MVHLNFHLNPFIFKNIQRELPLKFSISLKMGNLTTHEYNYQTFNVWIYDGFEYLQNQTSVWTVKQRECLINFLQVIKQSNLKQSPWMKDSSIIKDLPELFNRVKLAVPKTIKTAKIYAYTQNPKFNSTSGGITSFDSQSDRFDTLTPNIQIYLAHVYALVMFMWTQYQEESPLTYFYKSDVLHYAFQKENPYNANDVIDYSQIECFMQSLKKIAWTDASVEDTFYKKHLAPLKNIVQKVDNEMYSDISSTNSEKCVKCWQKGVAGKHFLYNSQEDNEESSSSSSSEIDTVYMQPASSVYREAQKKYIQPVAQSRIQCGGSTTTIEYLEEILAKLDLICEYHKLI